MDKMMLCIRVPLGETSVITDYYYMCISASGELSAQHGFDKVFPVT